MSYRPLPKELQLKAQQELNEVPSRVSSDIAQIREWIEKQPHLNARKDDQTIVTFLRHAKFSLERAKEKLDEFYTVRSAMPELFHDRDPFSPEIQEALRAGFIIVIKDDSDMTLPGVLITRWAGISPEEITLSSILKIVLMMMDILMLEQDNIINGGYILEDFSGISANYAKQCTPTLLKQCAIAIQNAYPIRTKGIYIINCPRYAEFFYNLAKPFMKEKLAKRFHLYGTNGCERIKQEIPLSLLPNEYGGTAGAFADIADAWKKKLESYQYWFRENSQYGTDETKRLDRSRINLLFGEEGSFRKLQLD